MDSLVRQSQIYQQRIIAIQRSLESSKSELEKAKVDLTNAFVSSVINVVNVVTNNHSFTYVFFYDACRI
jgi:hypothetical protein